MGVDISAVRSLLSGEMVLSVYGRDPIWLNFDQDGYLYMTTFYTGTLSLFAIRSGPLCMTYYSRSYRRRSLVRIHWQRK